jgi:hypothetical protein
MQAAVHNTFNLQRHLSTIPLECEHRAGASHPGLCFVKDQQMPPSRLI